MWLLPGLTSVGVHRIRDRAGSQAIAGIMLVIANTNLNERCSGSGLQSQPLEHGLGMKAGCYSIRAFPSWAMSPLSGLVWLFPPGQHS